MSSRTISRPGQARNGKNQTGASARGFTMIELLVAVLVMGIGVLGVAGLQLVSLQNNRESLARAEAVSLAYDMLDRIRVNPGVGVAGANYDGVDFEDDPPASGNCVTGNCSPAQMVNFDVAAWKCSLGGYHTHTACEGLRSNELLPEATEQPGLADGDGAIDVDGDGVITVSVRWTGFNDQVQTISVVSQG